MATSAGMATPGAAVECLRALPQLRSQPPHLGEERIRVLQ